MHLSYKTSKYKDKIYKSYSIAESYRENGIVKKQDLWKLGKLTEQQAQQIKLICKIVQDQDILLTTIQDIVVHECNQYGSLFIANSIWEYWQLSKAFEGNNTDSELSTDIVARILTLNRCVDTCPHYAIPKWVQSTVLPKILGNDLKKLNDDKIYYELDKIESNHHSIEDHLFNRTYHKDKEAYNFVNYDLSTSYFYGFKCEISDYGISKDGKRDNKQVVLGVLANAKGYPFKWDVLPGNTSDVDTIVDNVDACFHRFKLRKINLVFDRGFVSDDNLNYIDSKKIKFISALDKNQISGLSGFNISDYKELTEHNYNITLANLGFTQYDDSLFYKDLGESDTRRYVLGFNPTLFREEQKLREEKLAYFNNYLLEKNKELQNAKRSRGEDTTKQSVLNELKRLKIKKFFESPELKEITVERTNKKGEQIVVNSFQVIVKAKSDIIGKSAGVDGFCVFVTNHIEKQDEQYIVKPELIIKAYRDKTLIEDVFKHLKTFIKLRPFHVKTIVHVRAVYTLSMLAYFINKDLAERRKKIENIDYLNSRRLYEPFRDKYNVTLKDKRNGKMENKNMEFDAETKNYIKKLGIRI